MTSSHRILVLAGAFIALLCLSLPANSAEPPAPELRGAGKDLEMHIRGEVRHKDRTPANEIDVVANANGTYGSATLQVDCNGHEFETWIPLNRFGSVSVSISATSKRDSASAADSFRWFNLRQAAIEGLKLELKRPERFIDLKVIFQGKPVAGALAQINGVGRTQPPTRTDDRGVARIPVWANQGLYQVVAWTDDFRLGGFTFDRKPIRDADLNEHVIELSKCRDQKMRFVDQDGQSVPNLEFEIPVATPPPNYNYIGQNEHSRFTSDAKGEFVYRWFPDWERHHFYVIPQAEHWSADPNHQLIDGVVVFKLKKSKRTTVHGRVDAGGASAGGVRVSFDSFQGEQEHSRDVTSTYTNADGTYSVDLLAGATYIAAVEDDRWGSEIVECMPIPTDGRKAELPVLVMRLSKQVEITVTAGPNHRPLGNQSLYVRRPRQYSWLENGKKRSGTSAVDRWVTTDAFGRATFFSQPGKHEVRIRSKDWNEEKTFDVSETEVSTLKFHRPFDEKRAVTGTLHLADGLKVDLAQAEVRFVSLDKGLAAPKPTQADADGHFKFESLAPAIAVFVRSRDGKASGFAHVTDLDAPLKLQLEPTVDFRGQVLNEGDKPLVGRQIFATVHAKPDARSGFDRFIGFDDVRIESKTDEHGNFVLQGLPRNVVLNIVLEFEERESWRTIDELILEPNESRPAVVYRTGDDSTPARARSLTEQLAVTLRNCRLAGFHVMILATDGSDVGEKFVAEHFNDYETHKEVSRFMQMVVARGRDKLRSDDLRVIDERRWMTPAAGHVFACVLDATGKELGRIDIDVADPNAAKVVADFHLAHRPPVVDAEQKWHAALAEAQRTNRRVWARVSQRYCGPCFTLARWLDDHRELIEKDYVLFKVDDVRDVHVIEVTDRVMNGKQLGIPFCAIFDASGRRLIDSDGPLGNIGSGTGYEGSKHMQTMLKATRVNLTDAEIATLVESLRSE